MSIFALQSFSILGAGILTSFSPCVYPMIPITLGYFSNIDDKNKKFHLIGFVLGQIITFSILGIIAVQLGEILGFTSELPSIQIVNGVLVILLSYFLYLGRLPSFMNKWNNTKFFTSNNSSTKFGFIGAVIFGAVSSLIASPCTSPVLGGVLAEVATTQNIWKGGFLMALFALGMSTLFIILGLGLMKITSLPKSGNWLKKIHLALSILLFSYGLWIIVKAVGNL